MADALTVTRHDGLGLAAVMARKAGTPAAIGAALGFAPPAGPHWTSGGGLTLLGTGPGSWLALADDASPDWADQLRDRLGPLASVSDQSSGYLVFRLSGAAARTMLQRGAAIDFHPSSFAPGRVATTVIAHIGVIIRQVDDTPSYDIALFRSYAASFRHWVDATLAALRPA